MIFFLLLGIVLGAVAVLFALQNIAIVTVTFFTWQITASLALVLFATMIAGVVVTLLILLPSFIRDEIHFSVLKQQKKEVEDELAQYKHTTVVTHTTTTSDLPQ